MNPEGIMLNEMMPDREGQMTGDTTYLKPITFLGLTGGETGRVQNSSHRK